MSGNYEMDSGKKGGNMCCREFVEEIRCKCRELLLFYDFSIITCVNRMIMMNRKKQLLHMATY